jgi:hypothetical protein
VENKENVFILGGRVGTIFWNYVFESMARTLGGPHMRRGVVMLF